MPEIIKRALAGGVFVILVSVCLYFGGFFWLGLVSIFFAVALAELFKNLKSEQTQTEKWVKGGLIFIWFFAIALIHYSALGVFSETIPLIALPLGYLAFFLMLIPLVFILIAMEISRAEKAQFSNVQFYLFVIVYLGMGFLALVFIRHDSLMTLNQDANVIFAFAAIAGVWVSDTFAYLTGKWIGKHKISPISPNKTWEGIMGGVVFTALFEVVLLYFSYPVAAWYDALIFGVLLSTVSTYGDLFQSLWKRSMGVKDSGNLIPGHGGILDRLDAQLLAAPFSILYWMFIHNFFQ